VAERDQGILVLQSSSTGGDEKAEAGVLTLREQLGAREGMMPRWPSAASP